MKILAVEFSSDQRSAAVGPAESGAGAQGFCEAIDPDPRSRKALGLVEEALGRAGWNRGEIEVVAVGLGPGSYTGIRGAIALAQGWQLASGARLAGISSVEAIAVQAGERGVTGRLAVVIDAQRGEFYLAVYDLPAGKPPLELEPLRLAARSEVEAEAARGATLAGPEVGKWFPAGLVLFPRASVIGRLAAERQHFVDGSELQPIYLREAQFVKAPPSRVLPL